jgi:hypothetical protein
MRKSSEAPRFPNSALLFQFCLRAMEARSPGSNIHDQEIGNILQFNPSDTSHWKRGKKSVRSIYALEKLSRDLDADLAVVQEVAEGVVDLDEAWMDHIESAEERRLVSLYTPEMHVERRRRQKMLDIVASRILTSAGIESVPVYLPEILEVLEFIQITQADVSDKITRSTKTKPGQYTIKYRKGEMRPHTRAAIAREIARIVLFSEREKFQIPERLEGFGFFEIQDLSNAMLVPKTLLLMETAKVSNKLNLTKALSETFWVPQHVVRSRLKALILENAPESLFAEDFLALPERVWASPLEAEQTQDFSDDDQVAKTAGAASEG